MQAMILAPILSKSFNNIQAVKMPIEISWYDSEKTILLGTFKGEWTWGDYVAAGIQTLEIADGVQHRIDQIADMRESAAIPQGPALTIMNRNSSLANNIQLGITVLVGASVIVQGLVTALKITNPEREPRIFAASIEEAYALIQADRQKNQPKIAGN